MKVTLRADGFEGSAVRSRARAERLDRREKIKPEVTINFESPLELLQILTVQRVRLCEVARTQSYSVTGLAAALKRDPKSVRRDISKLEQAGVLRTREQSNPGHGRIRIVEPVAMCFELRARF